ncbi:hypothetical protein TBLA_0E01370 [Henningerozyma blattae CBS 6284]|uniref:Uncharacterized protein n=1 Tax=Henningerozyma blattae (strain ATCC 34711 / CBS 6284 / DSM 70876 / NBRC 10599 / NRRL Y-10934 / UCD 77-7) TaxID=1071380 RepID=I2H494_HENB6|nr:hypothetical protein TBLA_0E01370 [Tetrapisispora blattae CBS 6284]CCH61196.1 hypothetical protein TBLA_0E01370 [Tetrapisispora blattae CBS 6284]
MDKHIRYRRLEETYNMAVSRCRGDMERSVVGCFGKYGESAEGQRQLDHGVGQAVEYWNDRCFEQFAQLMEERGIRNKLDELDELLEKAKSREGESSGFCESGITDRVESRMYEEKQNVLRQLEERAAGLRVKRDTMGYELAQLQKEVQDGIRVVEGIANEFSGEEVDVSGDMDSLLQELNDLIKE